MGYNEQAIVKALIYSSIFDYPLTKEELWQYAISENPLDKKLFFSACDSYIQSTVKDSAQSYQPAGRAGITPKVFYVLPHEEHLISVRLSREKIAAKKLLIAQRTSMILSNIPTIQCICISGSLAMANTREHDDIDLFIITKQHTVWLTRICILLMLELLGKRRKKNATRVNNTICSNLFIEDSCLAFPQSSHNIYTAHEIAQVKLLFNRNHTYEKFVAANQWVKKFLPNALSTLPFKHEGISPPVEEWPVGRGGLVFLNFLAKKVQLWYMKTQRTSEIITDTVLAFYTSTTQKKVLEAYAKKIKEYEI